MSGQLRVRFGADMPAATVEVVGPDLDVVSRVMLDAGRSKTVQVPSEASFLRVYLPSGQVVTLQDPGNLDREITMDAILGRQHGRNVTFTPGFSAPQSLGPSPDEAEPPEEASLAEIGKYHLIRFNAEPSRRMTEQRIALGQFGVARLQLPGGSLLTGNITGRGREASWDVGGPLEQPPIVLVIEQPSGERLEVRMPGDLRKVWARADSLREQQSISLSVRLSTDEPIADTIVGYLHRGDVQAAEVMAEWIEEAGDMLRGKMANPYAASVGAYLLLRLRHFNKMRDWARNLADYFPLVPDGCIIWAAQRRFEAPNDVGEIRKYLFQAVDRGLPVYSEGVRTLIDTLRLLGPEGEAALEKVLAQIGAVLWSSPVTALIHTLPSYSRSTPSRPVVYDIALAAKA